MSQQPLTIKEAPEKKEPTKVFKSIAPTAVTSTTKQSQNTQPLQKNVPAFLNKLFSMVNDPESDDLICWSEDGSSFFVNCQEEFARKVLPRFFKHNKFSSFVRQLNMYGFHKVPHLQQGVLETDSESERWEFSNPHFKRNQPDLLLLVTRKKGPSADEKEFSTVDLQHILEEVRSIKKHQLSISSQLQAIQKENRILWHDTLQARERHSRHQETIDKILRFLASVFSSGDKRPALSRKRRFLLGPAYEDDQEAELADALLDDHESIFQESERPNKMPRQDTPPSSSDVGAFNLDDYMNGKSDVVGLSSTLPPHIKRSASAPNTSSTLKDAIAINDQAKHEEQTMPMQALNNISQLHNLQNLIAFAQANPELLSQLSSESLYHNINNNNNNDSNSNNNNTSSSTNNNINSNNNNSNSNNNNNNNSNNNDSSSAANQALLSALTLPMDHNNFNNSDANNALSVMSDHRLHQVTNSINSINDSTEALNQDIDDLGLSLQALAHHLGFDPTKLNANNNSLLYSPQPQQPQPHQQDNTFPEDEGELIDMDEFLNTYGSDIPAPVSPKTDSVSLADLTASTRSPSPTVVTPGSNIRS